MSLLREKTLSVNVRLDEFRIAIHQTHNCEAHTLSEVVHVTLPRRKGPAWEGPVHVFEISGHREARRCYAWPDPVNQASVIIRAVLHSERISSAERAVRSVLSRARKKRSVAVPTANLIRVAKRARIS
jgi:hypothetical protein